MLIFGPKKEHLPHLKKGSPFNEFKFHEKKQKQKTKTKTEKSS